MTSPTHPFDWLTEACQRDPDRVRFTYLPDEGVPTTLNGRGILQRSEVMAQRLLSIAEPGARVLLAYPAGVEFVIGFLACVRANLLPVPANYPKPRRPLSRYQSMVDDCGATLALTAQKTLRVIDSESLTGVAFHSEDTLLELSADAGLLEPQTRPADGPLFLQYTSGSTSNPLGVCISQSNLAANLAAIYEGFQLDQLPPEERVVCSWLPAYHDMGLVGVILSALVHDGHAVLMSPAGFSQRPSRWLAAMTDYEARVTVAPNFGYAWANAKIAATEDAGFDLSRIFVAACGAEPIDPSVLRAFGERFGRCGFDYRTFYPCYGLAESTLMVTGAERGAVAADEQATRDQLPGPVTRQVSRAALREGGVRPPADEQDAQEIVSSGAPSRLATVEIVAPGAERPCEEDQVGEIHVHSPSVASGYWNNAASTARHFHKDDQGRVFLRTGDLGFLSGGQLYVTGRLKDMLVLRGQNHYPQDIEKTVRLVDAGTEDLLGAAFLVDSQPDEASTEVRSERLVVVQEVSRATDADKLQQLLRSIRLAVAAEHDLAIDHLVLIPRAMMPRTSSGKVQRFLCREMFLQDQLRALSSWKHQPQEFDQNQFPDIGPLLSKPDAKRQVQEQIAASLLEWLTSQSGAPTGTFDSNTSFAEFGIDSVGATELSRRLEQWLGVPLSPVLAWSHPNVEKLSAYLADTLLPEEQSEQDADGLAEMDALLEEIEALDDGEAQQRLERL